MGNKEKAYQLYLDGNSYQVIADTLLISKTTAHAYVKEMKLLKSFGINYHMEPLKPITTKKDIPSKKSGSPINPKDEIQSPTFPKSKLFTGDQLITKQFEMLDITGLFLELFGQLGKKFAGMIWGLPKGGKSNFAIRFADYLQEYFGDVLYIAVEEGESQTLKGKIEAIGGSRVTFLDTKDINEIIKCVSDPKFNFVFIDSINRAGINDEVLESLKSANPNKSFVSIVQATKGGNFKGEQSLEHNCDFIIKVIDGIAYHEGRYGPDSQIDIFMEPLYVKNPAKTYNAIDEIGANEDDKNCSSIEYNKEHDLNTVPAKPSTTSQNKTLADYWKFELAKNKPATKPGLEVIMELLKLYPKATIGIGLAVASGYGLVKLFSPSKGK